MYSEGQPIAVPDTELTTFLFDAEHNTKCSLSIDVNGMRLVHEVDALYSSCSNAKVSRSYLLFPVFVSRCHGAFRGAVRLLFGGQTTEAYTLLRLMIENAMYAHYTSDDDRAMVWAQRGDSAETNKAFRQAFTISNMRKAIEGVDKQLAGAVQELYETSIDHGAHPNVVGHIASSKFTDSGVDVDLSTPGTLLWHNTVQRTVRGGAVCLKVVSAAPQSRFDEDSRKRIDELYEFTGAWKEFRSKVAQAEACGSGLIG